MDILSEMYMYGDFGSLDEKYSDTGTTEASNKAKQTPSKGFIRTYTGKKIYPYTDIPAKDIDIHDIAYALAGIKRYTGHGKREYSVAEHCVLGSYIIPRHKGWFLLHDAPEYIYGDVNSPTKKPLDTFKQAEDALMDIIAVKWITEPGESLVMPSLVHDYDEGMLWNEIRQNVKYGSEELQLMKASPNGYICDIPLEYWHRDTAAKKYIARFTELQVRGELHYSRLPDSNDDFYYDHA